MEAKAEQTKRNQCSPFALLKSSAEKCGKDPQISSGMGAGSMALWNGIIGEKSRLQAAAGNSASGDL